MGFRDEPIDEEIAELMANLNKIPGVVTQASCCGHGREPFYVWLQCSSLASIVAVSRVFDGSIYLDGTRTHYRVEVSPYHLLVKNDNLLNGEGKVVIGVDGKPIFCVNLLVTSTDLGGIGINIGLADEPLRKKEFATLSELAARIAKDVS